MIHNNDPRTFTDMSDNPENNGFRDDESRLVNPRNWGRDGEGEEDERDFDEEQGWYNEQEF